VSRPKEVGIQFQALADGQTWLRIKGCPLVGQWLMRFDPDAHGGLGEAEFTWDEEDALRFDSFEAADALWRSPSANDPRMIRELTDAPVEPNRPLMVVSVEVAPLP
jgi:hypothetical protein